MEEKFNRIIEVITEVQIDIAEIRKDVNYHILRTDQNDDKIEMIAEAIKPIQEHIAFIKVAGRLLTVLASVAAGVAAILALK